MTDHTTAKGWGEPPAGIPMTLARLADDDTVDPMTFELALILGVVTDDLVERDEWDIPDRLCCVARKDMTDDTGVGHALGISEIPYSLLPDLGHPAARMERLASGMRRGGHAPVPFDIVGWLLISEAWMLSGPSEHEEEYTAAAKAHRISEHPDRVEIRVIAMTDRAGRLYQTITRRDGRDEPLMVVDSAVQEISVEGAIPAALVDLMNATPMQEVTP